MTINGKKVYPGSNRRLFPRRKPTDVPFLQNVTFNEGSEARALNISRGGMLLETCVRLRPQTKILMKLTTNRGTFETIGHVLRCSIVSLKTGPHYHAAISFEKPFRMMNRLADYPAEQFQDTKFAATDDLSKNDLESFQMAQSVEAELSMAILTIHVNDPGDAMLL
jgi:hypothetical protein